jgi:predicted nucleotidyltransferase component of viral defense system
MSPHLLEEKIKDYAVASVLDQENVLQELVQQYVLASLARAGFFSGEMAVFHGGTCLRIAYGMNRFSEDLDFFLKRPDPEFAWRRYLDSILRDAAGEGFRFSGSDESRKKGAVKKAVIRAESVGRVPPLDLPFERDVRKLIKVKLEVDTNPPAGSSYEIRYLFFPLTAALTIQTLESGFGMKLGALLTRSYVKGRDWYDFIWYINKKTVPRLELLRNALEQQGPWAGGKLSVDPEWVVSRMKAKIVGLDWKIVRRDVQRFLPFRERETLKLWDRDFFLHHLGIFSKYLADARPLAPSNPPGTRRT